jgi:hypothetical protein
VEKRDITSIMFEPNNPKAGNGSVCFINVDSLELKNVDARKCLNLRHIMLEISYAKFKF